MFTLARYAALLRTPDLKAAIIASVIGRLPIGIAGLAIMLLAQASASFAIAGATTACYVTGLACVAPLLGRAIDRVGPLAILRVSALLYPAALVALVAAMRADAPLWSALLLAALAGASFPPITVCMRTLLKRRLSDDQLLAAAYSLEAVLIETIFIAGPMLVALFVAFVSPAAAVLFAAGCAFVGVLLFLRSPAIRRWTIEPRRPASLFGPLAERGFVPLLVVVLCYSGAFGLVEIGIAGYAAEAGRPALAGVLLGVMSVGSVAGGLAYGSRSWRLPLARQFAVTLVLLGTGLALLALDSHALVFALLCVLAGVVMAPALTIQSMLVAKISSPQHATEAFTWSSTGLLAGVGAGIGAGGMLLEHWPSSAVFVAAGTVSLAASALAAMTLQPR